MSTETQTTSPAHSAVNLEALDEDQLRSSLIHRFARIIHGNLTLGLHDRILLVGHTIAGTTFINPIEHEHLRRRLITAFEHHQNNLRGGHWRQQYFIDKVIIAITNEDLEIKVVLADSTPS
jgi:hypothetical protein